MSQDIEAFIATHRAFENAVEEAPEACAVVLRDDLRPDLAERRDSLLRATASLWEQWRQLGLDIRDEAPIVIH